MARPFDRIANHIDSGAHSDPIDTRFLWDHQTLDLGYRDNLGLWHRGIYLDGGDQGYFKEKDGRPKKDVCINKKARSA